MRPLRVRVCCIGVVGLALVVDCVDGIGAGVDGLATAEDDGLARHGFAGSA